MSTPRGSAMTLMDHLDELRSRLIKSAAAVAVGAVAGFFLYDRVLDLLAGPYEEATGQAGLAVFRPTEAFSVVMRVSLFTGLVIASPVVIYQLVRFVGPALTKREKRYAVPLSGILALLFAVGVLAGYWALERGLDFLLGFGGERITPIIGADHYLSFALRFILAFGIAFEFPVFLFTVAAIGVVTSTALRRNWRWAVVVILVGAALITPSGDPLTLTLMAVPLYVLYELTILAIKLILKR